MRDRTDIDAVHAQMSRVLCPFELTVRGRCLTEASFHYSQLGRLRIATSSYGEEVEVRAAPPTSFYVLQMPLSGRCTSRGQGPLQTVPTATPHVVNQDVPVRLQLESSCRLVVVRIDTPTLVGFARTLWDDEPARAPRFPEVLPLGSDAGASVSRCLEFLRAESDRPDSLLGDGVGARHAEQMLYALLLRVLEDAPRAATAPLAGPTPYYVKRAEEFMDANLARDIGLVDVVASAGVSVRTLHRGFARRHGMTPMAWLRQRRLVRVRADLLVAPPGAATVTDIALRWGFSHLGRFAAAYRARYGERPSDTLRDTAPRREAASAQSPPR